MRLISIVKKNTGAILAASFLLTASLAGTSFCADATFDNLTVNQGVGIGGFPATTTQGIFINHLNYGPGNANIYGYRAGGYAGTGWDVNQVESVLKAYNNTGDPYTAAVVAYANTAGKPNSAALVASGDRYGTDHAAYLSYCDPLSANLQYSAYFNSSVLLGQATAGRRWILFTNEKWFTIAPDLGTNFDFSKNISINRTAGQVGIGVAPENNCPNRLEVNGNTAINGTLYAKSLEVNTTIPWADYVFKKDYKVKSLDEVDNFIKKNGHLPGIPSEKEVAKNGVNVVDLQVKMLKTIEELTLNMITMKKENESLAAQNQELSLKIAAIEKEIK